jgi:hypothetical protein
VNGPLDSANDDGARRAELLRRIEALHPVGKPDGAQFVLGARLRLRRGIDKDAALRIVAELQAIGLSVEVEPNRPPQEAILALDQFTDPEPEPELRPAELDAALKLVALDAEEQAERTDSEPAIDREAETKAAMPPSPDGADDDARFRPKQAIGLPVELEVDLPAPPVAAPSPPAFAGAPTADDDEEAPPPPVDQWAPVPGRIAQGALRKNPALRIAIGMVLGLGLGWMLAQPYARRAERHVAELRAEADRERYRPVDEAHQRTAALDAEADSQSSSAAFGTAALWLVVAGAAFAGWWRLT